MTRNACVQRICIQVFLIIVDFFSSLYLIQAYNVFLVICRLIYPIDFKFFVAYEVLGTKISKLNGRCVCTALFALYINCSLDLERLKKIVTIIYAEEQYFIRALNDLQG